MEELYINYPLSKRLKIPQKTLHKKFLDSGELAGKINIRESK